MNSGALIILKNHKIQINQNNQGHLKKKKKKKKPNEKKKKKKKTNENKINVSICISEGCQSARAMQINLFLQKVLFQTFETHATGVCTPMLPKAMTSYATAQCVYLESQ